MSLPLRCLGLLALLSAVAAAELPLRPRGKPHPAILRTLADEPFRVPAEISDLLATPDGQTLFALHTNQDRLSVLERASGRPLGQLQIVRSSFDLSRDGTRVCGVPVENAGSFAQAKFAVWSWPARAEIWSKEMKRPLFATFSADGAQLAVLTMDNVGAFQPGYEVVVFDAATGEERWRKSIEQAKPGSFYHGLAFVGDRLLVSVTETAAPLWIFDAKTGEALALPEELALPESRLATASGAPVGLIYSQTEYRVVRADALGVKVISTGEAKSFEPMFGFRGGALSPDGKLVLMATAEECRVYPAAGGEALATIPIHGEHAAFSGDGKSVFVAFDHTVTVVPTDTWKPSEDPRRHMHATRTTGVAFSPDGKHLASNDGDDVFLWDVATGGAVARLRAPSPGQDIRAFAFDPARPRLYGNTGAEMWTWDLAKFSAPGRPLSGAVSEPSRERLLQMPNPPTDINGAQIALDRAGKVLVRTANSFAAVIDLSAKRDDRRGRALTLAGWERFDPVRQAAVSTDGRRAFFSGHHFVRIYDLATDKLIREEKARSPVLSPDGRFYAEPPAGNVFDTIVHDTETGAVVATLPLVEGKPDIMIKASRFAFSPDGSRLAAAVNHLNDGLGYAIWDVKSGQRLGFLETQRGQSTAFAFNAKGTLLAAANADGSIDLWDLTQALKP